MKTLLELCALITVATSLLGCSRQTDSAGPEAVPTTNQQTSHDISSPQTGSSVNTLTSLPEVSKAMQTGQYESAVNTLTQMKLATPEMTDAQRLEYQQAVRDAATALLNVREKDPAARAAYEKLSRSATGR